MDTQSVLLQIAFLLVLLALNGFFVAVEFAVVSVPRPRIDQLASRGSSAARLVQKLLEDPDRVLAASQLGITMASLALGFLGDNLAEFVIAPFFSRLPTPLGETVTHTIGFVTAFILITSLHIVLGEQAPKMAAIRFAAPTALLTARPIRLFDLVFRPFIALLDRATELVLLIFRIPSGGEHKIVYTADELKQMVAESQRAGELEPSERKMLHNVFDFGDRQVREVMIPRTDMVAVNENISVEELLQTFAQSLHGRYPVYRETVDDIVGYVSIKDILYEWTRDSAIREKPIKNFVRSALYVPPTKRVTEMLREMQRTNKQLAIVIDEYGGTEGMVTTANLLEEIVGDINDERTTESTSINRVDDSTVQVDAQLRIDEVNENLGTRLPESDDYETIAGLLISRLAHIPQLGESVELDDIKLTVAAMNGPRIEKILVWKKGSPKKE